MSGYRNSRNKPFKGWSWLVGLMVVSLLASACGGDASPKKVKIAVSLALGLDVAKDMLNAIQLALNEANGKAGKVAVELLVLNTTDPNGEAVSNDLELKVAQQAVDDPAVVAYLGPLTTRQARLSLPILNQASIAQVGATTTWPGLTKSGYGPGEPGIYYPTGQRHFFRVVPSDEAQGTAAARWVKLLGYKTVYLVNDTTAYGVGIVGIFELTAQDGGLKIVGRDSYDPEKINSEELAAIADRVVKAKPDILYLVGGAGANGDKLAKAVRDLEPNLPIMGPDALQQDQLITTMGANLAEGVYGTTVGIPASKLDSPAAATFLASYKAAYGKEPSAYVAAAYEAAKVLLAAIGQAEKPTREGVLKSMQSLGEYSGVFGNWHFDKQGDISIAAISGMQVKNGVWTFVQALK